MILVYNEKNINTINELLSNNMIAYLHIFRNDLQSYVIDYTTITNYPPDQQRQLSLKIQTTFTKNDIAVVVDLLDQFTQAMASDLVMNFNLLFDILENKLEWSKSFKAVEVSEDTASPINFDGAMKQLEAAVQEAGLTDLSIPELYEKVLFDGAKKSKYVPTTLGEVLKKIKDVAI
jgi:hypothetical protein